MNGNLNILALVAHASVPVQIVLVLLVLASFMSWVIIFRKRALLAQARREADAFEERFWSGADLAVLYRDIGDSEDEGGLAGIFHAGFHEYARQRQRRGRDLRAVLEGAQRAMRVAVTREVDRLEHNLEFLASVGSISVYVGLFGTVWGIMVAFQGLAHVQEATIASVAPGISEALIATAMGLIAAIPAVWAYNRYANGVERLSSRYDTFQDEFSSILQRQIDADEHAA
ncbi:MAG TPA: protein TolQ [Rhodanobacteraceae bacterium]|nr:protein TolQ [Rhodanobacteraceae bacterium]